MTRGRGHLRAAAAAVLLLSPGACGEGPVEPRVVTSLAPGDLRVLQGPAEVRSVRLPGGAEPRSYLLSVQNVGRAPGSLSMTLTVRGEGASASASTAPESAASPEVEAVETAGRQDAPASELRGGRLLLEARMREALRRARARPHRPTRPSGDARGRADPAGSGAAAHAGSGATAAPEEGDTLRFRMAVAPDLSVDCQDTTRVLRAVVRAVGERFLLAEDLQLEIGFSAFDLDDLSRVLDDLVFPVDSAYFGAPADIDGNGRVVALVTPEVNRLAPRGGETFIGGFFWPGDLSDRASCPASNVGEVLYLLAPDLEGRFADPKSAPEARRNAMEVAAHELEHLISAQRRITLGSGGFESLEEVWLSEGMAHIAEEVVGLRAAGRGVRENLSPGPLGVGSAFATFIRTDFARLAWHMQAPHRTPGLATDDPSGFGSLAMRGNAWLFLRWLADRFAPEGGEGPLPGADEPRLFRELAGGGPTHLSGIANVERAVRAMGAPTLWEELVAAYAPVLALDDAASGATADWLATWDLRGVFERLHERDGERPFERPYPLRPTEVSVTTSTSARFDLSVTAFGARYFVLESDDGTPDVLLALTRPGGGALSSRTAPQMSLVRLR